MSLRAPLFALLALPLSSVAPVGAPAAPYTPYTPATPATSPPAPVGKPGRGPITSTLDTTMPAFKPDGGAADDWQAELDAIEKKAWDDALKDFLPDGGRAMMPPFRWELKNVVENIEMPGIQESQGIPVKLHAVRVKNNLRGVLEEIVGSFEKQNLFIQPIDQQPQITAEMAVTGLDSDRFISYTAIIRCERGGYCTVVLGEANIGLAAAMKQMNKAKGMFAPVPSSARNVTTSSAEGIESISFSTTELSEADLKKWYATELSKLGFQPAKKEGRFRRGSDMIQLSTRRHEGELVGLLVRRAFDGEE
ncbi:MAG: hypothetical protein JNK82_27360 [Myxococcaceae bacterium]|nr:hypothetical protein [Myxococcaceae bacterium]